ncbi:unnamed protein product [Durusdinium trenchii]|uniref:Kinesin motor domain-containing protein n=1 Tax=Durusdinium trenchii TaxID=1381693 RepID=A0ABP0JGP4_9DINO
MTDKEAVCVGVRLRPFVAYEQGQQQCLTISGNVVHVDPNVAEQSQKAKVSEFAFDCAMDSTDPDAPDYVSQDRCYDLMAKRMVDHVLGGYFSCLFCYGQTGTGKTTTIMGKVEPVSKQGLLLRLMNDLFSEMTALQDEGLEVHCKVQMLEVYNEKVRDLLVPMNGNSALALNVPFDIFVQQRTYVKGVADEPVDSFENCVQLIECNEKVEEGPHQSSNVSGERLVELTFINQSLMWLASCIQALAKPETRKSMVPGAGTGNLMSRFRNSKLTLLLSNALSGNSKTSMIGTLSPALANFEESYSTLTFASTVKNIKIKAKPASAVDKDALVKSLQEELQALKEQLAASEEKVHADALTDKLEATEALMERYRKGWEEAQTEAKRLMSQRGADLEKLGAPRWSWAMHSVLAAKREDSKRIPHLVNYSDDPYMRGRLTFHP